MNQIITYAGRVSRRADQVGFPPLGFAVLDCAPFDVAATPRDDNDFFGEEGWRPRAAGSRLPACAKATAWQARLRCNGGLRRGPSQIQFRVNKREGRLKRNGVFGMTTVATAQRQSGVPSTPLRASERPQCKSKPAPLKNEGCGTRRCWAKDPSATFKPAESWRPEGRRYEVRSMNLQRRRQMERLPMLSPMTRSLPSGETATLLM